MAFASPAVRSHRSHASSSAGLAAATRHGPDASEQVRDGLTRDRLTESVEHLPRMQVLGFSSDWWDGQTHVPCLVVRGGRRGRRLRVVETTGECVVVPFARRTAQRWLAARRRPHRIELGIPAQRLLVADVVVDATADVVRCTSADCGVLRTVGAAEPCPRCGGPAPAC